VFFKLGSLQIFSLFYGLWKYVSFLVRQSFMCSFLESQSWENVNHLLLAIRFWFGLSHSFFRVLNFFHFSLNGISSIYRQRESIYNYKEKQLLSWSCSKKNLYDFEKILILIFYNYMNREEDMEIEVNYVSSRGCWGCGATRVI